MALPRELIDALADVRSVGVITGAGLSAESGIQTYRGKGGLYDDPEEGDRTVEALSGPTLQRDPARTWGVVVELARRSAEARPNAGHEAIARLEQGVESFVLLTQNVDGLHRAAGSENVIDIHGDVLDTLCTHCGNRDRFTREQILALEGVPTCESCGEGVRPDVVLFGEMLPTAKVVHMNEAFYQQSPDLVLIAGTTAVFPYIAEPVVVARRAGKLTVEVNPEPTVVSEAVEWSLRGRGGELLPVIADAILDAQS